MKYWRIPLDKDKIKIPHGQTYVIKDRCKGCSFCVEFCPKGVLKLSDEFNVKGYHPPEITKENECVFCGLCEMICPEFAIYCMNEEEEEVQVEG